MSTTHVRIVTMLCFLLLAVTTRAEEVSAPKPAPTQSEGLFRQVQMQKGGSPSTPGTVSRRSGVSAQYDPDLKPGFPVQTLFLSGGYTGGPNIHTLVGNIDDDPKLEIMVTGLASGPLYSWHSDGSPVNGWPLPYYAVAYPAMGTLTAEGTAFSVFASFAAGGRGPMAAFSGSGALLPGWPRYVNNYSSSPAALADVDGDGLDEIFLAEEDSSLHAYRADGTVLPGWPVRVWVGSQRFSTPAIADLDGDGEPEIVSVNNYLFAFHKDGSLVDGFPVSPTESGVINFPVIGDVDGDGKPEIILTGQGICVVASDGRIKRTIPLTGGILYGTAPALADLDGDGIPEIIVQTSTAVNVVRGDGSAFPGWPVTPPYWVFNVTSSPVVGDVDGDGLPDIAVTYETGTYGQSEVLVYNRYGALHPRFPKSIWGTGVPAIADIDLDGRNDIVASGDRSSMSVAGYYDRVWAYDLGGPPHGRIEWGQLMGGPKHQGVYVAASPVGRRADLSLTMTGALNSCQTVTYTIGVTNSGPDQAVDVVVGDPLPSGLSLVSAVSSKGACRGTGTVACEIGALAVGERATVTIIATPSSTGTYENTAAVTGYGVDPNLSDNTSTSATVITRAGCLLSAAVTGSGEGVVVAQGLSCDNSGCHGTYSPGTEVRLTATAGAKSVFTGWSGCDSTSSGTGSALKKHILKGAARTSASPSPGNTCTITMNDNRSITADFVPGRTITLVKYGPGSVTSLPAGINCGSACSAPFVPGSSVTFTATPAPGFAFAYWSGACSGATPACTVAVTADVTVRAAFDPSKERQRRLAVSRRTVSGGDGTVSSADGTIACGNTCARSYFPDTPVTLSAAAAPGSTFTGWGGACEGTGACIAYMDRAKTVTATFVGPRALKVVKVSRKKGTGTVTGSLPGINCGSDCSELYPLDTVVTLSASPDAGSVFQGWTPKAICSGAGTCTVNMNKAKTVTATFTGGPAGP